MSRAGMIAVGAALVAVATSLVAVIVVVRRPEPVAAAAPEPAKPKKSQGVKRTKVSASDVLDLGKSVKPTRQRSTNGVELDAKQADAFGLEEGDVIIELAGKKVSSERDVNEAVQLIKMLEARSIYVDLVRDGDPVLVRWEVEGDLRARYSYRDPPNTPPYTPDPVPDPDPLVASIKKIDDLLYEVPQATVDSVLANPMTLTKGARIVPAMKSGVADGFKMYAIRPTSYFSHLGFMNGDTIHAINGHSVTGPDSALDVYTKLKLAREFRFDITRRGKPVLLTIRITK